MKFKYVVFYAPITLLFIGGYLFYLNYTSVQSLDSVSVVIGVNRRPNMAEDGLYEIQVKDIRSGVVSTINAMGPMMVPTELQPICLPVPDFSVDDRVEFNLPKSKYKQKIYYDVCHLKDDVHSSEYYIRKI